MVEFLLDHGADTECVYDREITPLIAAVLQDNPKILKLLLQRKADANRVTDEGGKLFTSGKSALHRAAELVHLSTDRLEVLLEHEADVNQLDSLGNTPLNLGIYSEDFVGVLLKNGADPDLADCDDVTPLHKACEYMLGSKIVELLLKHQASTDRIDRNGQSPVHYAARNKGSSDALNWLLEKELFYVNFRDVDGNTPLNSSKVTCENFNILLRYGADANIPNKLGKTPVFRVCKNCRDHLFTVAEHFKKLRFLGYCLNEKTKASFSRESKSSGDSMGSDEADVLYKKELLILKNIVIDINSKTSLYDVLFMNRDELLRYLNNEIVRDIYDINQRDFEKQFPHYGFLLNIQYRKGLERKALIEKAIKTLGELFDKLLPISCLNKIANYLSNSELKLLTQKNNSL